MVGLYRKPMAASHRLAYARLLKALLNHELQADVIAAEQRLRTWPRTKLQKEGLVLCDLVRLPRGQQHQREQWRFARKDKDRLPFHRFIPGDTAFVSRKGGGPLGSGAGHGIVLRRAAWFVDILVNSDARAHGDADNTADDWRLDMRWSDASYARMGEAIDRVLFDPSVAHGPPPWVAAFLLQHPLPAQALNAREASQLSQHHADQLAPPPLLVVPKQVVPKQEANACSGSPRLLLSALHMDVGAATRDRWAAERTATRAALQSSAATAFLVSHSSGDTGSGPPDAPVDQPSVQADAPPPMLPSTVSHTPGCSDDGTSPRALHACGPDAAGPCQHVASRPAGWWAALDAFLAEGAADLNESQLGAIRTALSHSVSVLIGPPGTGKTRVAAALIAAWCSLRSVPADGVPSGASPLAPKRPLRRLPRALAVASSNVAVDALLAQLVRTGVSAVRVGEVVRVQRGVQAYTLEALVNAHANTRTAAALVNDVSAFSALLGKAADRRGGGRDGGAAPAAAPLSAQAARKAAATSDAAVAMLEVAMASGSDPARGGAAPILDALRRVPWAVASMTPALAQAVRRAITRVVDAARRLQESAAAQVLAEADVVCCTTAGAGERASEGGTGVY